MILVDANLLIYAYVAEMPQHAAAHAWLDQQRNTLPRVGLPGPTARHAGILGPLLREATPRANLVPDAHLSRSAGYWAWPHLV